MPRRSLLLASTSLLASAFTLGCTDQPAPTAPGAGLARAAGPTGFSVSGHVERPFPDLGVPIEKYSFHAHNLGNGQVEGQWQILDVFAEGSKEVVRGRVTCFTIEADGRTARLGGIVEAAANPANLGTEAVWTVVDNGEGAYAPPDQATDLRFGISLLPGTAAAHCEVGFPPEAFGTFGQSVRANVQVRP
jgi:hypothetical protein